MIGAVVVGSGFGAIDGGVLLSKIVFPALLATVIATTIAYWLISGPNAQRTQRRFRPGQIFTSSLVSLAHGTNDAQKTMGVITLTLIAAAIVDWPRRWREYSGDIPCRRRFSDE